MPEIKVPVTPDLARLHAFTVLVEKHAGAFRADLEKLMGHENPPAAEQPLPDV